MNSRQHEILKLVINTLDQEDQLADAPTQLELVEALDDVVQNRLGVLRRQGDALRKEGEKPQKDFKVTTRKGGHQ
jgi:hypothetical protein